MTNKSIKKHYSAIHTSGELSFLERKLSNILLYNAYDQLLLERNHNINISLLCELSGIYSRERKKIKHALQRLTSISITWDILNNDSSKNDWGASSLLSSVKFERGVCSYEYSAILAEKLANPEIFTRINNNFLQAQERFTSGNSLVIYEICTVYKGLLNKREFAHTKWIDIEKFKTILGVNNKKSYKLFKELNRTVIKPAVQEINGTLKKHTGTDLFIIPEYKRTNRKVSGIRFKIKKHPQKHPQTCFLFNEDENDIFRKTDNYKRLVDHGMSDKGAINIIKIESEDYIKEKLDFVDEEEKRGKIKSSASGLLVKAIQEDFKNPKKVKQEREQKKYKKEKEEQRINKQKEEKRNLESEKRLEKINSFYENKTDEEKAELFNLFSNSSDIKNNRLFYDRVKNKGLDDEVTRILFRSFLGEHFNLSVKP